MRRLTLPLIWILAGTACSDPLAPFLDALRTAAPDEFAAWQSARAAQEAAAALVDTKTLEARRASLALAVQAVREAEERERIAADAVRVADAAEDWRRAWGELERELERTELPDTDRIRGLADALSALVVLADALELSQDMIQAHETWSTLTDIPRDVWEEMKVPALLAEAAAVTKRAERAVTRAEVARAEAESAADAADGLASQEILTLEAAERAMWTARRNLQTAAPEAWEAFETARDQAR